MLSERIKPPARALRAQSDVAIVEESLRSGMAGAGIELKDTIRGIFQKPFEDKRAELTNQLSQTNMKGTPEEIERKTSELRAQYQPLAEQNDKASENLEKYLSQFVSGQMSQEQLLNQLNNEMKGVGIDVNKGTQASNEVELAIASFNAKSIQEEVKAFQQRAKLASETKQAILQSRIDQALGTFGGFEGFMNRPEEEEQNYIQKITPDLGKIEKTRGSAAFRYTNKQSIEEQEKQAPDLGRAFTNVYKELIAQSGGGFRDFLQQTIDQGIQQTGAESRDGKAGASARGGFDDIVRGRQQDLEQQLKLAEDQIKVTTDPVLKRDLQGFVDSIRKIPGGTKGIAQLQTQKELGVARQGDFAKLYGKYENEALNRLKDISPELAASLENAISLSDDPLVAQAELQTQLQGELVGYMAPIQAAILKIANLGGGSVTDTGVSPTQIEAYKPKLTEEQQKKADEIRTAQEQTAKKEADIKAKKAQEAALPKDNRTTSEIEAATRAKRDQKYLQSPVAPRNRATGEKFGSMEEIDAEMNKALALGAINPEQKEYYGVLQNFKKNLDPTATTFGRQYDYDLDEKNRPVDPNSPLEIEKRTAADRDKKRFETWSQIGGMGLGPISETNRFGAQELRRMSKDMISPEIMSTNFGRNYGGEFSPTAARYTEETAEWTDRDMAKMNKDAIFRNYPEGKLDSPRLLNDRGIQKEWTKASINAPFSKVTYGKAMQGVTYAPSANPGLQRMEFPSADRGPGLPIDLQSIDFSPAVSAIAIGNEYLSIIAQQSVDGQKNTELEKMTQAESIIGDITQ